MLTLEQCRDIFERAMIALEENDPAQFSAHMLEAAAEATLLYYEQIKDGVDSADRDETREFTGQCYFEMATHFMEECDRTDDDAVATKHIEGAKDYLRRALKTDIGAAYYKSAVLSLSEILSAQHDHQGDIELCLDYVRRLTEKYSPSTPQQNDALSALAQAYASLDRMDEAEATYKKILEICAENFGADSAHAKEAEEDLAAFIENKAAQICPCQQTL